MKLVFVDTGGFFAFLMANDASHGRSVALFQKANREGWRLLTTNVVVFETYALLIARGRDGTNRLAIAFLDHLGRTQLQVERVTAEDEARAFALVRAHRDKTYSLADASSFVVMERLGVGEAIAFDDHFRQFGRFPVL